MNEIPQNTPEQNPNEYLAQLRKALNSKDAVLLREVVDGIQRNVHGTTDNTPYSPLSDSDISILLETGTAMINVGSGTHGQCMFFKNVELHMPPCGTTVEKEKYVKEQRMNFKLLFDLPPDLPDTQDLRVSF